MDLWVRDLKPHWKTVYEFEIFIHKMAARIQVGEFRYGIPNKRKNYMTRIFMEFEAYRKSGNSEHLLNIANYCILETIAPENKKHHSDNTVDSVTRGRI